MKEKTKRIFIVVLIICLVISLVVIILNIMNKRKENEVENINKQVEQKSEEKKYEENKQQEDMQGSNNVKVDGNKVINTSNKLKETKNYKNCHINVVSVITENKSTDIVFNITNNTTDNIDLDIVTVEILDDNGKVFKEISAYFGKVKSNSTKESRISMQIDVANMHDLRIK